jgi:hypothetical protein
MGWMVNDTPWPLYPRERDQLPIIQEVSWAPGLVCTGAENLCPQPGFDRRTVQAVWSRYTDGATQANRLHCNVHCNVHFRNFSKTIADIGLALLQLAVAVQVTADMSGVDFFFNNICSSTSKSSRWSLSLTFLYQNYVWISLVTRTCRLPAHLNLLLCLVTNTHPSAPQQPTRKCPQP